MPERLPDEVERFIEEDLDSLEQLEILLLLRSQRSREFEPREVTAELRLGPESAPARLAAMAARGFLAVRGEPPRYRFAPDSGDKERVIDLLARSYAERRVAVITKIFSDRRDSARTFANAFKLRRQ